MTGAKKSYVADLHNKLRKRVKNKKNQQPLSFSHVLEDEFVLSWDLLENLYTQHPLRNEIMAFINVLRSKGYDKIFRAGQMRWVLMLSRSLKHGLRENQSYVYFQFADDGMTFGFKDVEKQEIIFPEISWQPEIEAFLAKLQLTMVE